MYTIVSSKWATGKVSPMEANRPFAQNRNRSYVHKQCVEGAHIQAPGHGPAQLLSFLPSAVQKPGGAKADCCGFAFPHQLEMKPSRRAGPRAGRARQDLSKRDGFPLA